VHKNPQKVTLANKDQHEDWKYIAQRIKSSTKVLHEDTRNKSAQYKEIHRSNQNSDKYGQKQEVVQSVQNMKNRNRKRKPQQKVKVTDTNRKGEPNSRRK